MMDRIVRRNPMPDPAYGGTRVQKCAFTGHRPHKLFFAAGENSAVCQDFKARLRDMIRMLVWEGYSHFISGGAQGMDMYAAEIVLELRQEYPWIGLEMAVPFDGQAAHWSFQEQLRYNRLLTEADIVTYVSHEYTADALYERNRYMVDQTDLVLAAYSGHTGGTAMTLEYARLRRVPVTCIAPVVPNVLARISA